MKDLNIYLNESRQYALSEDERTALDVLIGFLTGNLGDTEDIEKFDDFKKTLSKDELDEFENIYDYLDDDVTFKKVRISSMWTDIRKETLRKFLQYVCDNEYWDDYEYEVESILDLCK